MSSLKITFLIVIGRNFLLSVIIRGARRDIPRPGNYELIIQLAEKLSHNIPFVRIDFYETNGRVFFGELTFYPGSGFEEFRPMEWDNKLGDWVRCH